MGLLSSTDYMFNNLMIFIVLSYYCTSNYGYNILYIAMLNYSVVKTGPLIYLHGCKSLMTPVEQSLLQ